MQLGMIGLGRMGAKVAAALRQQFGGHAIRALEAANAGEDPR